MNSIIFSVWYSGNKFANICHLPSSQHCKEKNDWAKLAALYVNARATCENSDDLQKLSLCITEILTKDSEKDRPGVPFCDFADAGKTKLK